MKLVVLKNNLRDGLSAVEKSVVENNNLPILKNVLIKTFNNKIKLSSTNLELAITKYINGKVIEEGSLTVPFHTLFSIVQNLDSERINLEVNQNTLLVKTDNYEALIQGLPEDEFPIIPKIENINTHLEINSDLFKEGLNKVINAAQYSEIRPELSGVLLDFQITNFKLVTTDSFRLAEKTFQDSNFKSTFQRGFKIIIPLKTAQEFLRIPVQGSLLILIDPNQVLFKSDDLEMISRLIDGSYPEYDQIIPKSVDTEVVLERDHLFNSVKLVSTFSGKTSEVKLSVKDGKKNLEVHSANQYVGENKYLVPAKIKGEVFNVSFNWRYLMDGLKNFDKVKDLTIAINGETRPAVIKSPADTSFFYILMPIRI